MKTYNVTGTEARKRTVTVEADTVSGAIFAARDKGLRYVTDVSEIVPENNAAQLQLPLDER